MLHHHSFLQNAGGGQSRPAFAVWQVAAGSAILNGHGLSRPVGGRGRNFSAPRAEIIWHSALATRALVTLALEEKGRQVAGEVQEAHAEAVCPSTRCN
jgi:hypothetical protein